MSLQLVTLTSLTEAQRAGASSESLRPSPVPGASPPAAILDEVTPQSPPSALGQPLWDQGVWKVWPGCSHPTPCLGFPNLRGRAMELVASLDRMQTTGGPSKTSEKKGRVGTTGVWPSPLSGERGLQGWGPQTGSPGWPAEGCPWPCEAPALGADARPQELDFLLLPE